MKTKIEIKSRWDKVIFEYEQENNTIKDTLQIAVKQGINLEGADLRKANLRDADLEGANLYCANLESANLKKANLKGAGLKNTIFTAANLHKTILEGANLCGANFYRADLKNADLKKADLKYTTFTAANLEGADLEGADLEIADFYGANLYRVNFEGANLYGANFYGAREIPFIRLACPSEGSFIGWKKVKISLEYGYIPFLIKLEIPEDALRSSATTSKCRCNKAKVLEITNIKTGESVKRITNINEKPCVYKVGEMVFPDKFDENRFVECSHGIHFFVERLDAMNY